MAYLQVAIGLIVRRGRILVARRPPGVRFAGQWEFPGGKLLPEESATDCLHRELAEELGVSVKVIARLAPVSHDYGDIQVTLHPFIVAIEGGEPTLRAAAEMRWVTPDEMLQLSFPAANVQLLPQLQLVLHSLGLR